MKTKRLGFDQRHDLTKKLPDHLSDARRIIRPGMINTKLYSV